ncbi:MAG: monovalent cation/H(+) antiporter subunit G [Actinomycetota bacterium]|jgi:multicomponent Na+:H+ antiporter subunit G|nr:monovalent cation/H(+) antiporter subunit G [Actinomycetota bacterium]MDA3029508.1 monovalent cation/H(+) antiporter subunit G [Actinomycetota bacterium]
MGSFLDVVAGVLLMFGSALILLAGVGVWRFDDIYARMHAAAKAPTLGILAIALGAALSVRSVVALVTALLVVVLQLVTGPVGTHLLGRAVYRRLRPPLTGVDELARDEAGHES